MYLKTSAIVCEVIKVRMVLHLTPRFFGWAIFKELKGTQDWEFFWLRFWNLRYFFDSYVKILKWKKILSYVQIFLYIFSSIMEPKYDPILVFWKFN